MNFLVLSGLLNALSAIIFGSFVFFKKPQDRRHQLFLWMNVAIALWGIGYGAWRSAGDPVQALFFVRVLSLGSSVIPILFLHWVLLMVGTAERYRKLLRFGYVLTAIFILFGFSPYFVENVETRYGLQFWPEPGILYHLYLLVGYVGFIGFGALQLIRGYKQREGHEREQLKYILFGTIIGFGGGATNFPLWYQIPILPIGNFLVAFYPIILAYAILQHRLFDVKVVATQILTGALWVALTVELFLSDSPTEFLLRFAVLGLVVVFGYLLIRSVLAEVRQRERLQELTLALETANEDLKRLDKARREFVSIASHQLRTPLSAIKGFVSMILEGTYGKVASKPRDALGKVYQSNERLIKLVNDLLDLSRIEAGRMQYEFQEVKFDEMVESVVDELKLKAEEKKLRLTYTRPREALPSVWADPTKLRQVVMNLIDNAIKYTPEGSVAVSLKRLGNEAWLEVADTGVGLEPEEKEHLFHMFHRGAGGKMYHTEGTGLGLYIAKKIIEDHKGRIEVSSPGKGKGSTFSLILPLGSPRNRDEKSTR